MQKKRRGGKLDPQWLGPYLVVNDLGKGFYSLRSMKDNSKVERVNGAHLKVYISSDVSIQCELMFVYIKSYIVVEIWFTWPRVSHHLSILNEGNYWTLIIMGTVGRFFSRATNFADFIKAQIFELVIILLLRVTAWRKLNYEFSFREFESLKNKRPVVFNLVSLMGGMRIINFSTHKINTNKN